MLVFLLRGDPAFSMLQPTHDGAWSVRGGFPVAGRWDEVEFSVADGAADEFVAADCLAINTGADGFLISEYARDLLKPALDDASEFWPVRVLGRTYWWLNCMPVVAALDRERTEADWSTIGGGWGSFSWISTTRRLAFHTGPLEQAPLLFRVPEYPQGVLFAMDGLKRLVERHELTGFKFEVVWSLAEGGVRDPSGLSLTGMFDPIDEKAAAERREAARRILKRRDQRQGT